MLGGLDPIIIFQFSSAVSLGNNEDGQQIVGPVPPNLGQTLISKIPIVSKIQQFIDQPPIPIYLSETQFGLYIQSESKNVDIQTETQGLTTGQTAEVIQNPIQSGVTIQMTALKDSLGLILLSSMIDLIFDKTTSKEYAITYMHGPTTIFRALLHSFSIDTNNNDTLAQIKIELSRGEKQPTKTVQVPSVAPASFTL